MLNFIHSKRTIRLISNNMHELQQILLKKLPRLGELTFWCEVFLRAKDTAFAFKARFIDEWRYLVLWSDKYLNVPKNKYTKEILGHPFTHADLLEALGEDWAIQSGWQLWKYEKTDTGWWWTFVSPTWEEYPCLPDDISDLSLPEYEETRKQLIQLLTK